VKHKTPLLLSAVLMLLIGSANGQSLILNRGTHSMPTIAIAPDVTLVPYNVDQFPDLAPAIKPYMTGFENNVMVLMNDSGRDITAATVVWSYKSISHGGSPTGVIRKFDQYGLPVQAFVPLVAAHSKAMIAPMSSGFERFKDALDGRVQIEVDSVVFADGEIHGPDRLDFAHEVTSRFEAAKLVSGRLHTGRLAAKGAAEIAEGLSDDVVRSQRHGRNWVAEYQTMLAHIYANPDKVQGLLNTLDNLVQPPTFHKAAISNKETER
jgi:hypothetical protein